MLTVHSAPDIFVERGKHCWRDEKEGTFPLLPFVSSNLTLVQVTTGALFIAQCAGNVLGPNLYTTGEAPLYHRGLLSKYEESPCFSL